MKEKYYSHVRFIGDLLVCNVSFCMVQYADLNKWKDIIVCYAKVKMS